MRSPGAGLFLRAVKHGGPLHQAKGRANIVFMDGHVEGRSLKQTNGILMEFKK